MLYHPRISIILPVYNTQAYLKQAIDSVVNQSYDDVELIAINDASTDDSLSVLKSYAANDKRIRLIDLKENQGLGRVRNLGMVQASGNYFVFLDSDDFLEPNALQILNDHILKKPDTQVFVYGFNTCNAKGTVLKTRIPARPDKSLSETPFSLAMLGRKGFEPFAWVYMVKRTFIEKHSIAFAEGIFFEDIQFSTQILYHAQKVARVDKALYNYRKHGVSITGCSSKQKIDDKFTAFTSIKTFLQQQGVFQHYQGLFLLRFLTLCVHTSFNEYFGLSKAERDKELDDYMHKIRKSNLFKNEKLLLLRNLALSLPKAEKGVKKTYLGAYFGLKAIRDRYPVQRFVVQQVIKIHRFFQRFKQ